MKLRKYFTFFLVSVFFFINLLFPCTFANLIKFATEATYPPYVYVDASGKVQGFGADIVRALCKQMKVLCKISNQPWDSLIPSLNLGKFDAIFGGIDITELRKKEVYFTEPYYSNSISFIAAKKKYLTLSPISLKGKIVGVQGGTSFDMYLQQVYGNLITIRRYPSEQEALMDLKSGRDDIVVGDTPLLLEWLKKSGRSEYSLIGNPINDSKYFGQGVGIAVKKGNQFLLESLDQALEKIKANGTYATIVNKYFGNLR